MFFGVLFGSNANFAKQQPIFGKEKKRESDSLLRLTNKALNLLLTQFVYFGTGRNKNRLYVTKWHKQHFYANKQIHFLYPNFKSCRTDFVKSIFHVFNLRFVSTIEISRMCIDKFTSISIYNRQLQVSKILQ